MVGSSPADDTVDTVASPTETITDVTPASSPVVETSASTPDTTKGETMLDAVKTALKPKVASPATETPDTPVDADPTDKSEAKDELSAEELAQLSAKTQQRFKTLTSKLHAKDEEISSLSPKAREYDNLHGWVRNAGLSDNDVKGTLEIASLMRNNPRGALERILPVVRALQDIVGETLSAPLQARVDQGFLTLEDAKVQQRAIADGQLATRRATALTEQQARQSEADQNKVAVDSTVSAVSTWEKAKATSDPDWHLKRADIAELVELAILKEVNRRGAPWFPSQTEAVKLAEDALKKTNTRYSRFVPKPAAMTPAIGGASNRSISAPKTMLDVVKQAAAI